MSINYENIVPQSTVVVLVPRNLITNENAVDLPSLSSPLVTQLYRNTCFARFFESAGRDTALKLSWLVGGERTLYDELLRRMDGDEAPADTGGEELAAAVAEFGKVLSKRRSLSDILNEHRLTRAAAKAANADVKDSSEQAKSWPIPPIRDSGWER